MVWNLKRRARKDLRAERTTQYSRLYHCALYSHNALAFISYYFSQHLNEVAQNRDSVAATHRAANQRSPYADTA